MSLYKIEKEMTSNEEPSRLSNMGKRPATIKERARYNTGLLYIRFNINIPTFRVHFILNLSFLIISES